MTFPHTENKKNEEASEECNVTEDTICEIRHAIKSLLFYKIEMPTNSSNKSIINNLNVINKRLEEIKNCNIYLVSTL